MSVCIRRSAPQYALSTGSRAILPCLCSRVPCQIIVSLDCPDGLVTARCIAAARGKYVSRAISMFAGLSFLCVGHLSSASFCQQPLQRLVLSLHGVWIEKIRHCVIRTLLSRVVILDTCSVLKRALDIFECMYVGVFFFLAFINISCPYFL